MAQARIELHQFQFSHYNEKVRWALDYKQIAHDRINYLPGPHAPQIQRMTGQRAVPVLRVDGKPLSGSARIIEEIERRHPSPALYPADAGERDQALAIQKRFDDELGPATRRMVFDAMFERIQYIPDMFSTGKPAWKRTLYRNTFPLVQGVIRKANGVSDHEVAQAGRTVDGLLDFIARETARSGHLVGNGFSIADLTGAALLAPLADVSHPDMAKPEPMPPRLRGLIDRLAAHPGMMWVHRQYAGHRPPSCGTVVG